LIYGRQPQGEQGGTNTASKETGYPKTPPEARQLARHPGHSGTASNPTSKNTAERKKQRRPDCTSLVLQAPLDIPSAADSSSLSLAETRSAHSTTAKRIDFNTSSDDLCVDCSDSEYKGTEALQHNNPVHAATHLNPMFDEQRHRPSTIDGSPVCLVQDCSVPISLEASQLLDTRELNR
jgi:hypothetical protein